MRRNKILFAATTLGLLACNAILGLDGDSELVPAAGLDASFTDVSAADSPRPPSDGEVPGPDVTRPDDAGADSATENRIQILAGALGGVGSGDGTNEDARFNHIIGAVADEEGNRYVIERGDPVTGRTYAIRKVDKNKVVTTFAGDRLQLGGGGGRTLAEARFKDPRGLLYDYDARKLWVLDDCRLRRIDIADNQIEEIIPPAGTTILGCPHQDSPATIALGATANAIALGPNNTIFISEPPYVRQYSTVDQTLVTICGSDTGDLGQGACNKVQVNANELVYSAESNAVFFRMASQPDGSGDLTLRGFSLGTKPPTVTLLTGPGGITPVGGLPGSVESGPGIALGPTAQSLLLAERQQIRFLSSALGTNEIRAGSNTKPPAHVDGEPSLARFEEIGSISQGPAQYTIGDLSTLRASTSTSKDDRISTIAGLAHTAGFVEGLGKDARFGNAKSMTLGPYGKSLFFYDSILATIDAIDLDPGPPAMRLVAGIPGQPGELTGDRGKTSTFPLDGDGIVFDGTRILFSSSKTNTIRAIDPVTGSVTTPSTEFSFGPAFTADPNMGVIYYANAATEVYRTAGDFSDRSPVMSLDSADPFEGIVSICWERSLPGVVIADQKRRQIATITLQEGVAPARKFVAGALHDLAHRDGNGTAAGFYNPDAVACDGEGHVYVTERALGSIRLLDLKTGDVTSPLGVTDGQHGILLGPLPGRFNVVSQIVAPPAGPLFIGSMREGAIVSVPRP